MRIGNKPSLPLDITKTYETAAQVKGVSVADIQAAVYNNARNLFKLK
jgi:Tat protein secretion system quality control protein TatD with DNase activity